VKFRENVPKATKEKVFNEFNHRCAVCGTDRPQLHHIDENPSNNEAMNLIPLCPNCHLIDQHNPIQPLDSFKLVLLRKYKDPHILKPQFHPIFTRLRFLFTLTDDLDALQLDERAEELVEFIRELEKGSFYSKKIADLIRMTHSTSFLVIGDPESERLWKETGKDDKRNYLIQLEKVRYQAIDLIIELLRYQNWNNTLNGGSGEP